MRTYLLWSTVYYKWFMEEMEEENRKYPFKGVSNNLVEWKMAFIIL